MLHLRYFRYFQAVAEELNFHRAAERVHVSQPALWRQMRDLEAELGVDLLDRHPRGIQLTAAGKAFLEDTLKVLERVEAARERAVRVAKGQVGVLRIGFNEIAARNRSLPRYFQAFRSAFPNVELQLNVMMSQRQLEALEASEIDAGFVFHRPIADTRLGHHKVSEDDHILALPRDHRLAKLPRITLGDLTGEPLIFPSPTLNRALHSRLMAACLAGGLAPRVTQHADNEHTLVNMVATGMGVAFVNASCPQQSSDVVLRPIENFSIPIRLELVWRNDMMNPALGQFIRLVKENPADRFEIDHLMEAELG